MLSGAESTIFGRVPVRAPRHAKQNTAPPPAATSVQLRSQPTRHRGRPQQVRQQPRRQASGRDALPDIHRGMTRSAPAMSMPVLRHQVAGTPADDSLRRAWTNARQKRDDKLKLRRSRAGTVGAFGGRAADEEGGGGERPQWNSLFGVRQQYESNAVSIRNRVLRGHRQHQQRRAVAVR